MPELPDIESYATAIVRIAGGQRLLRLRIGHPFLLRSVEPKPAAFEGRTLEGVRRLGKRVVLVFDAHHFAVIHLMIAGRLHWRDATRAGKVANQLAEFEFEHGRLILTEAGTKRRASLHLLAGETALREHDPGGLEPLNCNVDEFCAALKRESHTLKRALTNPKTLSGIGNAYSDEILHRARLSPLQLTVHLDQQEVKRLHVAMQDVLGHWRERLKAESCAGFPDKVTAFRPEFAVHGKFGAPCPDCGAPVQRIVYAENECNYCARCQTGGKLLADRALSRLLKASWPKTLDG
jgi:formamidopyrimidine-DNA glycosylase